MRNEFEKQVREKMEELNFVPSDPVWEKIEEQIRTKKDRRKLIFWIPMLALLLGGGTWWLNTTNEKQARGPVAVQPAENKIQNSRSNPVSNPQTENKSGKPNPVIVNVHSENSNQLHLNEESRIEKNNFNADQNFSIARSDKSESQKQSSKNGVNKKQEIKTAVNTQDPASENPMGSAKINGPELKFNPDEQKILTEESPVSNPVRRNTISLENLILPVIEKNKPAEKLSDSRQLIVSAPASIKYTHKKNWNFGASAALGFSGAGEGFNAFNQEKSLPNSYYSNSVIPAVNNTGNSSPAEKSISFGFGLVAKKQLSKRLHLSTGLAYKYFSTKTRVGVRINAQRAASPSVGSGLLLDQNSNFYYISYGTSLQEYYNQYHIISVPFSMEMQLLKKLPLNVNAGVSINQLVKTNALQYNQANQVYYYDKNAFNRTQVFADFGLDYPVYDKKIALFLGPQFNYSVNAVNKNGKSQHLYAMQLRARLMLKK